MKDSYRYLATPRIAAPTSVPAMMFDVIVALIPTLGMAIYLFGWYVLVIVGLSMATCLFFQYLYGVFMKRMHPSSDPSALVTGFLLAFCYPVNIPLWAIPIGSFFAIVVVKELYGGLGRNFVNPALAGRMILATFPSVMTEFSRPVPMEASSAVDVMSGATPMAFLHNGEVPPISLEELVLGFHSSSIGEGSSLMLCLGGMYLLLRRVISPVIPVSLLGTVAILCYLFPPEGVAALHWTLAHLFSGGLILGAIFMATDPVTSPTSPKGQVYFGIGCGMMTVLLRYFGSYPEGIGFAILLMNGLVWVLDYVGAPRPFAGTHFAIPKRIFNATKRHLSGISLRLPKSSKSSHSESISTLQEKTENANSKSNLESSEVLEKNSVLKCVVSYSCVFLVTVGAIAFTHHQTQLQTYRAEEWVLQNLMADAMPEADFLSESPYNSQHFETLYFAYRNQEHLGYCIHVTTGGFNGELQLVVGVSTGGAVTGIAVIDHKETLQIGTNALNSTALSRFKGRSGILSLSGDNAIDGISGATVTLTAVTDAVNQALKVVQLLDQVGGLELLDDIL